MRYESCYEAGSQNPWQVQHVGLFSAGISVGPHFSETAEVAPRSLFRRMRLTRTLCRCVVFVSNVLGC